MTVAALAGRRVDAGDASAPRFPIMNIRAVRQRIRCELERLGVQALVCSAACGADLLALSVARDLGIERRAVLPFEPARFRRTSVADRPGDWAPLFDRIVADLREHDGLVTLASAEDDARGYLDTNLRILDEAESIGRRSRAEVVAILVWDGDSRGQEDVTAAFGEEARRRGLPLLEISTLDDGGG